MADYNATSLVKAQAKVNERANAAELRQNLPKVWLSMLESGNSMIDNYEALKTSTSRAVEGSYLKRSNRSLGSSITYNPSGSRGDGGVLSFSWSLYSDKFGYSLKQANNNVFSLEEQKANEMYNMILNFNKGLNTASEDFLFSNRTAVNDASVDGNFVGAGTNIFEVTEADHKDYWMQVIKTMLDSNGYENFGSVIFADYVAYNKLARLMNPGGGAELNTSVINFGDGIKVVKAQGLLSKFIGVDAKYKKGAVIAAPEGTFGALPWIGDPYRQGNDIGGPEGKYGTIVNPFDNLDYGVLSKISGEDNIEDQDMKVNVQSHIEVAFQHAPISEADETPLFAAALV